MNDSYINIIDALKCNARTWNKVKDDLSKVTLINCKKDTSYGLCYNGTFLGVFIQKNYIDLKELKDTPFTYIKNRILG